MLVYQRNQARDERDRYLALIRKLIALDEAPRSVHYSRAWQAALEDARDAVGNDPAARSASTAA
jgi:hypothetical protein